MTLSLFTPPEVAYTDHGNIVSSPARSGRSTTATGGLTCPTEHAAVDLGPRPHPVLLCDGCAGAASGSGRWLRRPPKPRPTSPAPPWSWPASGPSSLPAAGQRGHHRALGGAGHGRRGDLSVARAMEPHLDACAILAESGAPSPARRDTWGVFAAEGPGVRLEAGRPATAGCSTAPSPGARSPADLTTPW